VGTASRVPSLWIYAENDLYFGISTRTGRSGCSRRIGAGGQAELHVVPSHGADGHDLVLDPAEVQIWSPIVDQFLRVRGLPTWISDHAMVDALVGVRRELR
jgi:hypothetical protein